VRSTGVVPVRTAPEAVGGDDSIDDDTEQVHIVMGCRALARGDEDREALDVVNHVFGGGLSSRLFEEIRERRGLAYSVYSGVSAYADSGRSRCTPARSRSTATR
jgi:predicted Zn-dependent peptidase